jgi:hypothetical protein
MRRFLGMALRILGDRRYLTDQLIVEAEVHPAYNRMCSTVTESYHPGITLGRERARQVERTTLREWRTSRVRLAGKGTGRPRPR